MTREVPEGWYLRAGSQAQQMKTRFFIIRQNCLRDLRSGEVMAPVRRPLLSVTLALVALAACGGTVVGPDTDVPFRTIGDGYYGAYAQQGALVIRDASTWAEVLPKLDLRSPGGGIGAPVPAIDFSKEMVIVVALGQRPSGGFSVRVQQILGTSSELVVKAAEERPGPTCAVTLAITRPLAVVALTNDPRPVRLEWTQAVHDCG